MDLSPRHCFQSTALLAAQKGRGHVNVSETKPLEGAEAESIRLPKRWPYGYSTAARRRARALQPVGSCSASTERGRDFLIAASPGKKRTMRRNED